MEDEDASSMDRLFCAVLADVSAEPFGRETADAQPVQHAAPAIARATGEKHAAPDDEETAWLCLGKPAFRAAGKSFEGPMLSLMRRFACSVKA